MRDSRALRRTKREDDHTISERRIAGMGMIRGQRGYENQRTTSA